MKSAPIRTLLMLLVLVGRGTGAEVPTPDALALKLLDGEALYTVSAGLKPVSEGFWSARFPESQATAPEVEAVRRLLASLPLGPDLEAGVQVYSTPFDGERSAAAFVAHKPSLRALLERRADVFAPMGLAPGASAQSVMDGIDRASKADRWRGYGLVFGYPDAAVEFFVAAGEEQSKTGKFVARDFLHIPTHASDTGRFVYAVPKGHAETDGDRRLRASAGPILERYCRWRALYTSEVGAGGTALLRDWLAPPMVLAAPPMPAAESRCVPARRLRPIRCRRADELRTLAPMASKRFEALPG